MRSTSASTASVLSTTRPLSFDFSLSCARPSAAFPTLNTHSTLTLGTGTLENPPSTRNGRGAFSVGSHTAPKRSPPSGSQNSLNVSPYTRYTGQNATRTQHHTAISSKMAERTWRSSNSPCAGSNAGCSGASPPDATTRAFAYLPDLPHTPASAATLWWYRGSTARWSCTTKS